MPHVDEGTLHALLDGALRAEDPERAAAVERHLAACEDCRARLDAAAELRGEAGAVLGHAAPADSARTPDFDEVLARAGARRRGGGRGAGGAAGARAGLRRQARWTRGIAWAASLVVALGTGYLIRDLAGPTAAVRETPAVELEGEAAPGPAPAAPTSDRAQDPAPGAVEEAASERETAVARDLPVSPPVEALSTPASVAESEAVAGVSLLAPSAAAPAAGGRVVQRWSAVPVTEARAVLDGPVYLLPRASLTELYVSADTAEPRVMSRQRLESGVDVEVVQWRGEEAAAPDAPADIAEAPAGPPRDPEPTPEGRPALPAPEVALVVRGPYLLQVTGPLPAEMLSILAGAAQPVP